MVVIVAIHKLWSLMLLLRGCDAVKMRMHRRRMIMVGTWMNVLKRRNKECQQNRQAGLYRGGAAHSPTILHDCPRAFPT